MSNRRKELEYFDSTIRVGTRLRAAIQRSSRKAGPTKPERHLSYFLFSKALKSLDATRLLWASGFFQDAMVISRTIFEAFLLDLFIRRDRKNLTHKYIAYDTASRHHMSVGILRSMKNRRGKAWRGWKTSAANYGRAAKNLPYELGDARGWSGKSLREIVRLFDHDDAEGIWTDYEFFYALGSAVAHSLPQSMQEYLRRPYRTSYKFHGQRRAYLRDLPILTCRWCLVAGVLSTQDHFLPDDGLIPGDALVDAVHLLRQLTLALGEDLKDPS